MPVGDAFCEPIALTSAYTFASAQDAWEKFSGARPGNVYSRFTNPTVRTFELRAAALEHAEDAVAFASGMGAITAVCIASLHAGANVVCARDVFGSTLNLFRSYLTRFGTEVKLVDVTSLGEWAAAIDARTRVVLFESPSNPLMQVGDIAEICQLAHAYGALVVVDNTMLTPIFQKPHALGADYVVHSAGKYMDGQGRCVAGVVTCSTLRAAELRAVLRTLGISLSPMNAWLLLKGLETLEIRMIRIAETCGQLASWLSSHPLVDGVYYTGLPSHPRHDLANRQQAGHGGLLSFLVHGDRQTAWSFVDRLQLIARATNIGDTRSMITHPATTTHCKLTAEDRLRVGIADNLVRLSVGLESVSDLTTDVEQALAGEVETRKSFTMELDPV